MKLRRILILLLIPALLLAAAACGNGPAETPPTPGPTVTPEPTPEPMPEPSPEPTSEPTPEPTPEPDPEELLLEGLSLREQLWQMVVLRPSDLRGGSSLAVNETMEEDLQARPAGGFFLDTENMQTGEQLRALTGDLAAGMAIPPLILCDEEGGAVARLGSTVSSLKLRSMYHYKDQGEEKARENGEALARELRAFGFNADLAPVADVWSNPANTVIRYRAYSDDFAQAARLVAAAVEGFHAGGVLCTLKHFPGHGDTKADSHYGSVYVSRSLDELRERELLPFRAGIEAGADMVMIGHLIVSAVDEEPALFSHALVTELLREELGFQGVVITDALQMGALGSYTDGETAVKAVLAGVDLLLCPGDPEAAVDALEAAVTDGVLTEERIRESLLRILRMKLRMDRPEAETTP
ncbi:MAG: glycoside hydrolase family 3 protein [Oscillospiraceae bacterium]|nr:glycoside hydrolase family 3 protein [Oscillospiraceae bacterium]